MKKDNNTRAKKGGQIGVNGSLYKGGQFLPSSASTVRGELTRRKSKNTRLRKREIEPYVWTAQPSEGAIPIYGKLFPFAIVIDGHMKANDNIEALEHAGYTLAEIETLVDLWNSGERWIER